MLNISIEFLRRFHRMTPWALASFGPGANEVGPAQTFDPAEEEAARRFISEQHAKHNIYFAVNRVRGKLAKKASKRDIAEIHYLHVDADLCKTLDWSDPDAVATEQGRVLGQLRSYSPPPTATVWSGGGYQAFWRLTEPIVVEGDTKLMAPVERRMQRIEKAFDADSCHNADRIMRLPGTLNVLGPTKIKAGRKAALAEVVEFHDDRAYELEDFPEHVAHHRKSYSRQRASSDTDEIDRICGALSAIPADSYNDYLQVGMVLKAGLGEQGFPLYETWAKASEKFDSLEIRRKWRSIKPDGGITIATLYGKAREYGWRDEPRAANTGWSNDGLSSAGIGQVKAWPILGSTAAHGLVGEMAKLATLESEADPVAVMGTALAWGAAVFGRNRFYSVGDTLHHARLFCALVGASSRARKGTSLGPVQRIFGATESDFEQPIDPAVPARSIPQSGTRPIQWRGADRRGPR